MALSAVELARRRPRRYRAVRPAMHYSPRRSCRWSRRPAPARLPAWQKRSPHGAEWQTDIDVGLWPARFWLAKLSIPGVDTYLEAPQRAHQPPAGRRSAAALTHLDRPESATNTLRGSSLP